MIPKLPEFKVIDHGFAELITRATTMGKSSSTQIEYRFKVSLGATWWVINKTRLEFLELRDILIKDEVDFKGEGSEFWEIGESFEILEKRDNILKESCNFEGDEDDVMNQLYELRQSEMMKILGTTLSTQDLLSNDVYDFINLGHRKKIAEFIGKAFKSLKNKFSKH
jgi:hypothetical protein